MTNAGIGLAVLEGWFFWWSYNS